MFPGSANWKGVVGGFTPKQKLNGKLRKRKKSKRMKKKKVNCERGRKVVAKTETKAQLSWLHFVCFSSSQQNIFVGGFG